MTKIEFKDMSNSTQKITGIAILLKSIEDQEICLKTLSSYVCWCGQPHNCQKIALHVFTGDLKYLNYICYLDIEKAKSLIEKIKQEYRFRLVKNTFFDKRTEEKHKIANHFKKETEFYIENNKKLDSCKFHQFRLVIPESRWDKRYICKNCGGECNFQELLWYKIGLSHGGRK